MDERPWYETVVMPALLRGARRSYGGAMRRALAAEGMDDIPANGMFVLGELAMSGRDDLPLGWFVGALGVSKQAVGQLIDALVSRDYVERRGDVEDRRRSVVSLTDRGVQAARVQAETRERIDADLLAAVGPDDLALTRRTLAVLADIGRQDEEAAA